MNKSYKIALIVTIAVCVVVIGYSVYTGPRKPAAPTAVPDLVPIEDLAGAAELVTPPPTADRQEPPATFEPDPAPSLADRVRLRTRRAGSTSTDASLASTNRPPAPPEPVGVDEPARPSPRFLTLGAPSPSLAATRPEAPGADFSEPSQERQWSEPPRQATVPLSEDRSNRRPGDLYTVARGDTFTSIAAVHFGSADDWQAIAAANPTVDPLKLRVGQVLKMPQGVDGAGFDSAVPAPPVARAVHQVRRGESLWTIADRYYQDGQHWRIIYNANRGRLGSHPNQLRVGDKLNIPPAVVVP